MQISGVALLGAGLVVFAAGGAVAQERPPIVARAEACLRDKAERVAAVEPGLHAAANFLVSYACAEATAGASRYERNVAWLGSMKAMTSNFPSEGGKAPFGEVDATVDPESGEFVLPNAKPGERVSPLTAMLPQMSANAAMMLPDTPPVGLRKLAGELILAIRERGAAKKAR